MATSRFPILRGPDAQQSRVQDNVQAVLSPLAKALQSTPIMGAAPPAWTALQMLNGFSSFVVQGTYVPAVQLDALGYVHGRGYLRHVAGAIANTACAVLPLAYRPGGTHVCAVSGSAVMHTLVIDATGTVTVSLAVAAGTALAFEFVFQAGG